MTTVEVFAPAKVNLTLHVTGQRADGYHLLDSLVAFADLGDTVTLRKAETPGLQVDGPFAQGVPTGPGNLVLRAAALTGAGFSIRLEKRLPPASGIGGGSADAAATIRGARALGVPSPDPEALTALGADIPMCLLSTECRVQGIGDQIEQIDSLPPLPAVLVNPGVAVETPRVFSALPHKTNPVMPEALPETRSVEACSRWLSELRNDLEAPAKMVAPVIGQVIETIAATDGALLARMSGSGATCFGLYPSPNHAKAAARAIAEAQPGWWVRPCTLGGQSARAKPRRL